jgi:galactokinase
MLDVDEIRAQFERRFGVHPRLIVCAPGRVNLIGEHTDYNDGFVLPVAIDRATYVAARPHHEPRVLVHALDMQQDDQFSLDSVVYTTERPWSNYVRGVVKGLQVAGHQLAGADLLIASDVPRGAGLSSSAALEVGTGYALQLMNRLNLLGEELALLAQGAENSFVGVQCGIMDQFISALGQADHAMLLDCRDLSYRLVPIPEDAAIVICDSHIARTLAGSAYNERRQQCETAVTLFQQWYPKTLALRDISLEQLAEHEAELPEPVRSRARHVITENQRTLDSATALGDGDLVQFGQLMNASHVSMRDDYQITVPAIDQLVAAAQAVEGCYGSRMTGGGFGGCTVSLVATSAVERFQHAVTAAYQQATGITTTIYVCRASDGVGRAFAGS